MADRGSNCPCCDLDRLTTLIKVEGYLVNETPLRIGTGKAQTFASASDNPLMMLNDSPVIPGSSLKGALRSLAESYVKTWDDPKYNKVCGLDDDEETCQSCTDKSFCIPCVLFGFKDLAGRVVLMDAIAEEYKISERTMVAIDRVFGGQSPGKLYTLDYVEPKSRFKFTMIVYNLDFVNGEKEEWKQRATDVLKYLLKLLTTQGVFVGGRKTVGFGLVKLEDYKVYLATGDLMSLKEVNVKW